TDTQPTIFDNEATVTITDNEAVPSLIIEEITESKGAEGNSVGDAKILKFRVRPVNTNDPTKPTVNTDEEIKFTWSTVAGGTATAGTDFTPVAPIQMTIPV